MPRLPLITAIAALCTSAAHAESTDSQQHELHLGIGTYNSVYIARGLGFNLSEYLDDKWSGGPTNRKYSMRNSHTLKMGYAYRIKDNWWMTLDATTQNFKDNTDTGEIKTWMLGARRELLKNGNISIYSGAAVGQAQYSFETGRADATHTAYQIDAMGVRFGQGAISGQVVLGYGFAGLLQAGINARF